MSARPVGFAPPLTLTPYSPKQVTLTANVNNLFAEECCFRRLTLRSTLLRCIIQLEGPEYIYGFVEYVNSVPFSFDVLVRKSFRGNRWFETTGRHSDCWPAFFSPCQPFCRLWVYTSWQGLVDRYHYIQSEPGRRIYTLSLIRWYLANSKSSRIKHFKLAPIPCADVSRLCPWGRRRLN
jgi:hypothetical protein